MNCLRLDLRQFILFFLRGKGHVLNFVAYMQQRLGERGQYATRKPGEKGERIFLYKKLKKLNWQNG